MAVSHTDYSFWANLETWTLKEAIDILTNHRMFGVSGDEADVHIIKAKTRFNVWGMLTANIITFAADPSNIKYQSVTAPSTNWGTPFPVAELADELQTAVDVHKLLRWASAENISVPLELRTLLRVNPTMAANKADKAVVANLAEDSRCFQGYLFQETAAGWNLQFGDVRLSGVKDKVGLGYIRMLIASPGDKISVIELERKAGVTDAEGLQDYDQDGYVKEAESACGGVDAWETIDVTAKGEYRRRLEEIAAKIKDARATDSQAQVKALIEEAEFIEKELKAGSFRPKDPEIEKIRKRVRKCIDEAILSIGKLEGMCSYNEKPLSSHLKRYIRKGSFCSYTLERGESPEWTF